VLLRTSSRTFDNTAVQNNATSIPKSLTLLLFVDNNLRGAGAKEVKNCAYTKNNNALCGVGAEYKQDVLFGSSDVRSYPNGSIATGGPAPAYSCIGHEVIRWKCVVEEIRLGYLSSWSLPQEIPVMGHGDDVFIVAPFGSC